VLHEPLRDHFREDRSVRVVVEMRARERRLGDRRGDAPAPDAASERRRVKGRGGRRVADRRTAVAEVDPLELPRRIRGYVGELRFVRRQEETTQRAQDIEDGRLVVRIQSGDATAFSELYMRKFDAVYSYARMALKHHHEAEDVTQLVFIKAMDALPRFELRADRPFRAWLFRIARNEVLTSLRKSGRWTPEEPEVIGRREPNAVDNAAPTLDWISDADLLVLIERLPEPQRQVITLRYMLDLTTDEMCTVLERTPDAVRKLEHRALRFLEQRLATLREGRSVRAPMLVRMRRAPVLGSRRFALAGSSARHLSSRHA
jgi:RNA polymerase sigma-70 factor (ECF subfamily)